jgi:hypothetical protein
MLRGSGLLSDLISAARRCVGDGLSTLSALRADDLEHAFVVSAAIGVEKAEQPPLFRRPTFRTLQMYNVKQMLPSYSVHQ